MAAGRVLKQSGISASDIDLVVLGYRQLQPVGQDSAIPAPETYADPLFIRTYRAVRTPWRGLEYRLPRLRGLASFSEPFYGLVYKGWARVRIDNVSSTLGVKKDRVITADHHFCHALSAIYGSPFRNKDLLVFTADGVGDGKCASVTLVKDGKIRLLSDTHMDNSLALLYLEVTRLLGMKVLNDEYKVMGLAPYASTDGIKRSYSVLNRLVSFDERAGNFRSLFRFPFYYRYLRDNLEGHRFDNVAGAAQKLVEDLLVRWVRFWVNQTKVGTVCFAGGLFMNVKANMMVMEMPEIERMFVFPSAGDESIAFGAAYYGYQELLGWDRMCDIEPLSSVYLGPSYGDAEVEEALNREEYKGRLVAERHGDIDGVVAQLLSSGKIVARLRGRMEWGARALGNRSILSDASNFKVVKEINVAIKQRDFWMPFAPTILWERKDDYMVWTGKTDAPFMVLAFRSKKAAQDDLSAAVHPYDLTMRPQVLERKANESYYSILNEFQGRTGRGGILNTSFNLHGEPIVCSPADALHTFMHSGLHYLALEGHLVTKSTM